MGAFREAIAKEVRKEMLNPEFDTRYGRAEGGGRIFWVRHATAKNFGQFVKEHPPYDDNVAAVHTTITDAIAAVVAGRGDEVRITSSFSISLGGVISLSTAAVRWVGEGYGNYRPTFTVNNSAQHGIAIHGDGVKLENVRFAAPSVDEALSMIRVKASGVTLKNIDGQGSDDARNFVDCIRVMGGSSDLSIENVKIQCGRIAVNSFLSFEGPTSRFFSSGFYCTGSVAASGVIDATGANVRGAIIRDWQIAARGSGKAAVTLDATKGEGVVKDCQLAGTATTLANNGVFSGDWRLSQVFLSEETGNGAQGALIPAADTD